MPKTAAPLLTSTKAIDARLVQLRDEREAKAAELEQVVADLGAAVAAGDSRAGELRRRRGSLSLDLEDLDQATAHLEEQRESVAAQEATDARAAAEAHATKTRAEAEAAYRELDAALHEAVASVLAIADRAEAASSTAFSALRDAERSAGRDKSLWSLELRLTPFPADRPAEALSARERFERSRFGAMQATVHALREFHRHFPAPYERAGRTRRTREAPVSALEIAQPETAYADDTPRPAA